MSYGNGLKTVHNLVAYADAAIHLQHGDFDATRTAPRAGCLPAERAKQHLQRARAQPCRMQRSSAGHHTEKECLHAWLHGSTPHTAGAGHECMVSTVTGVGHCIRNAICVTRTRVLRHTWVVWRALHRVRLATACAQTCLMPLWRLV